MALSIYLFTLFISLLISLQSATASEPKPDFVIEIFRHGARSPMYFKKLDPAWGNQAEQVTPLGTRMQYLLGVAMREQYGYLIENCQPHQIYLRSTDIERTIDTAYAHLAGFCGEDEQSINIPADKAIPPYKSQFMQDMVRNISSNSALPSKIQIIPAHTVAPNKDYLLLPFWQLDGCPNANYWWNKNADDPESTNVFKDDLGDLSSYLRSKGLEVEKFFDLFVLGDLAICNKAHGMELLGNVDPNSQFYQDLKLSFEWFNIKTVTGLPVQAVVNSLFLFRAILDSMQAFVTGSSDLKFVFFSGHDTSMVSLLNTLGIVNATCYLENYRSQKQNKGGPYPFCYFPQFASNIIFEFYNTSEPYVKFLYDGVGVPFCGSSDNKCTYNQFVSYVHDITNNLDEEGFRELCEFSDAVLTASVNKLKTLALVLGTMFFLVIGCSVFLLFRSCVEGADTKGSKNFIPISQKKKNEDADKLSERDLPPVK